MQVAITKLRACLCQFIFEKFEGTKKAMSEGSNLANMAFDFIRIVAKVILFWIIS